MNKQQFIEYITHTPLNSNQQVLETNLSDVENEEVRESLIQYVMNLETKPNLAVLQQYIDQIFKDFAQGQTYTVRIDNSNSNPDACCVYLDDAANMTKGSSEWDKMPIFNSIKPCILKDGKVQYYLNPNDYSLKEDGTAAVLTGEDGDVMVEFSKFAYRIYNEDNYTYVSISNDAETIASDLRFVYLPFTRNTEGDVNKSYIGAYHGNIVDGKLRSISGAMPTVNTTIGDFRTAAQANGAGYEQLTFYQMTMLQCLYLIRYCNLNAQAALGAGYTMADGITTTGATNASGMYFGDTGDYQVQVKFAGIEDFYGNVTNFVDGAYCNENYHIMVATDGFNNEASGYTDLGAVAVEDTQGILTSVWGDSRLGFVLKTVYMPEDESAIMEALEENFCDASVVYSGCFPVFGSAFEVGPFGGAFFLGFGYSAEDQYSLVGARLSFY